MLRAALTGGIGSGKSSAARLFFNLGCPTLDLDRVAHDVTGPGKPALAAIAAAFGPDVLQADGTLARGRLAALVFHEREALRRLESIIHPAVMAFAGDWMTQQAEQNAAPVAMLEIPLLFEAGLESTVDRIVLVTAETPVRLERLASSRGMTAEDALARIAAQMPDDVKRERSDYVIENNGSLESLREKVEETWQRLLDDASGAGTRGRSETG